MRILLTNDDGIYAEGIYALFVELGKVGRVTVVAPDSERSSVGHGITLAHPIWHKKINRKGKPFGIGISGTPADCVKFATAVLLKKKPDLIVSGINLGPNDGCSVHYSGTVAGAREGAMMGIPAMAVSLDTFIDPDFSYAAKVAAKLAQATVQYGIPRHTFLNVNVPAVKGERIRGIKFTRQGTVPIHGTFRKRYDPNLRTYHWMSGRLPSQEKDLDVDTCAVKNHYVAVTPICCDLTDYAFLPQMEKWNPQLAKGLK